MDIITVSQLKKHFRTFKKEAGMLATFRSIVKRDYLTVKALDGITFTVKKGEIRGFIGPNGAGKSTTIKILSGILYPTAGSVQVNGLQPWEQRERYVKTIGVVFGQKQQLWMDLPPLDTFHLNRALYEIPEERFHKNLDFYVKLMDLKEIIRRPARQLSLGEKMKCELISSLLHDPDIVYLDEPTIGLDIISKEKIRQFIRQVNEEKGTTFLLTTHDLDDIENLCRSVIVINKGKIVFDGLLSKLKSDVLNTKIIEVTFKQPVEDYGKLPDGIKMLSKTRFEVQLEVDRKKHAVERVLNYVIKHYPIKDINVSSPAIESVVKRIYEKS